MNANITVFGESYKVTIKESRYNNNGNIALVAYNQEDNSLFGKITANIDETIKKGYILVKTYGENEEWVPQILAQLPNNFRSTGQTLSVGFTELEIWEYFPESINN
jgi:hypothetical protein